MFHFLKGIIIEKITEPSGSEKIILEVNGIGYEVQTTLSTLELVGKKGDSTTVYTALIHKEDQMSLIGFTTLLERELFNLLLSVSGVGAKTALCLLNELTVSEISYSILNEDVESLRSAQGIGTKTASRIILDLKEKINNWKYLPISRGAEIRKLENQNSEFTSATNDARSVLQSLGYSNHEISKAFSQIESNGDLKDTESFVHLSLKWLASVKS